ELYNEVITKAGYEVELAVNGEEGFQKLQAGGYSLILLDMRLTDMSGVDVLAKLQNNPPNLPNGPVILLTNMEFDDEVKKGLENGANSYLVKADLTPEQLITNIKKLLPVQTT
ncbi:MAG TPA: response regulator, partial [Xanthomonadales bacterium]|nr:response regulator [Xanthomonadales bacterium]